MLVVAISVVPVVTLTTILFDVVPIIIYYNTEQYNYYLLIIITVSVGDGSSKIYSSI